MNLLQTGSNRPQSAQLSGPLLFARYAFMPNHLGYCGGPHEGGLFEACTAAHPTPDLKEWAMQFEGAFPYLKLIACENGIADPLDRRVVEAYWIGNDLLTRVDMTGMYASLRERFASRLSRRALDLVLAKAPAGARPHHSFHVMDVCRRTGSMFDSLDVFDNCRIAWGQVERVFHSQLEVRLQPLELREGRLRLGRPQTRQVMRQIDGRGFVDAATAGDWVAIHWGWACDRLDRRQVLNLRRYTQLHLGIANQTL